MFTQKSFKAIEDAGKARFSAVVSFDKDGTTIINSSVKIEADSFDELMFAEDGAKLTKQFLVELGSDERTATREIIYAYIDKAREFGMKMAEQMKEKKEEKMTDQEAKILLGEILDRERKKSLIKAREYAIELDGMSKEELEKEFENALSVDYVWITKENERPERPSGVIITRCCGGPLIVIDTCAQNVNYNDMSWPIYSELVNKINEIYNI